MILNNDNYHAGAHASLFKAEVMDRAPKRCTQWDIYPVGNGYVVDVRFQAPGELPDHRVATSIDVLTDAPDAIEAAFDWYWARCSQ